MGTENVAEENRRRQGLEISGLMDANVVISGAAGLGIQTIGYSG